MVPEISTARDRFFFVILGHFLPFYPRPPPPHSNNPKYENIKKMKKDLEISSFYTSVPKLMIICYTVPEIWCVTDVIVSFHFYFLSFLILVFLILGVILVFHFGQCFALLPL